jgi:hypothetical protein
MVIRKQHIISWLLNENYFATPNDITIPMLSSFEHSGYLANGIKWLCDVRDKNPNWGLPELLMPSFEKVMKKSAKSFFDIDHQLFQQFSEDEECGILLDKVFGTIVYGFGNNTLYVWLFRDVDGRSVFYNYFYYVSTEENKRLVHCNPTIIDNPELFNSNEEDRQNFYSSIANLLISYLAVKKYAKVETIIVPDKKITILEDNIKEYKYKEKVRNESGQEVIVMDSRWFVKIINENDIFVRGFFRLQNKKNEFGEWYKELIYVDSFIRHGYHRNAKIEDEQEKENNNENDQK